MKLTQLADNKNKISMPKDLEFQFTINFQKPSKRKFSQKGRKSSKTKLKASKTQFKSKYNLISTLTSIQICSRVSNQVLMWRALQNQQLTFWTPLKTVSQRLLFSVDRFVNYVHIFFILIFKIIMKLRGYCSPNYENMDYFYIATILFINKNAT